MSVYCILVCNGCLIYLLGGGQAGNADPLDGWRCRSQKQVMQDNHMVKCSHLTKTLLGNV